jgi:hypothetical protein
VVVVKPFTNHELLVGQHLKRSYLETLIEDRDSRGLSTTFARRELEGIDLLLDTYASIDREHEDAVATALEAAERRDGQRARKRVDMPEAL